MRKLKDIYEDFIKQSIDFKVHSYVNRVHQAKFESYRTNFKPVRGILVVDFSEKFNNQKQDEIQALFLQRCSFTLFIAALFVPNLEKKSWSVNHTPLLASHLNRTNTQFTHL